jgi:hypothetical protein
VQVRRNNKENLNRLLECAVFGYRNSPTSEFFPWVRVTPVEPRKGTLKKLKIWVNICKMLLKLIYLNGIIFSQKNLIKFTSDGI